jgi:hypothetical protein
MQSNLFLSDKMMKKLAILTLCSAMFFSLESCRKDQLSASCESNKVISFSAQIRPMIDNNCISCHGSGGSSPVLITHENIAFHATHIMKSLTGEGAELMPLGGPALNDSLITQFSCWIAQGKKNN